LVLLLLLLRFSVCLLLPLGRLQCDYVIYYDANIIIASCNTPACSPQEPWRQAHHVTKQLC
jgi:hypothetical protein